MATSDYIYAYISELSKDPIIKNMIEELGASWDKRKAYPNVEQYFAIPGAHDTHKWLQTIKEVYYGERQGMDRQLALRQATSNWNVTEVYDFLNWLRFYEEGTHLKYKVAQFYYGNADVGYLLPIKPDVAPPQVNPVGGQDIDFARDAAADDMPIAEKKRIIEKQRHKIIGRLDSAEKLLRSQEGQLFADKELATLLEAIYELKKKVQMINKRSTSTRLYDDLIVREANILNRKGFVKAASVLYSLANGAPPAPKPADPPAQGSGAAGGLPATGPGTPEVPPPNNAPNPAAIPPPAPDATAQPPAPPAPAPKPAEKTMPKGLADFVHRLQTSNKTVVNDKNKLDDSLEVIDGEDDLVVEAQAEPMPAAPPMPPPAPPVAPPEKPKTLEVKEEEMPVESQTKDVDKMLGAVFSNLTIADVVAKFEDIAKFYKTREMPRQLAMADMMLDSLGLAPFFPALSEATNKALEANNYISTRIEDILAKLRGTIKTRDIDLKGDEAKKLTPEIEQAQSALKEQEDTEAAKKKVRKDLEDQALREQMKETPEIEVEEDLGATPPAPPATPPAPVPPPPARPPV